jgi:hypothetical protein
MMDAAAGADGSGASDSGGTSDAGADADAALSMCGTATTGGSGDACNSVTPTGPCVVEMVGTGAAPTPAGGAFVAGTFDLVSSTLYALPDAGTDAGLTVDPTPTREVSVLTGSGNAFTVQNAITSGTVAARSNGSLGTDGTTKLTFTPTCPEAGDGGGGNPGQLDYTAVTTASGTTVTTFNVDNHSGGVQVKVYKKR